MTDLEKHIISSYNNKWISGGYFTSKNKLNIVSFIRCLYKLQISAIPFVFWDNKVNFFRSGVF